MEPEVRATIAARFAAVGSSNVADALDEIGLLDQGLAPTIVAQSGSAVAGWAFTIAGEEATYDGGGDPAKMKACGEIGPGEVAVWAGGSAGTCCFGELIALGLRERGCVGALVDGGVRDVSWLRHHGFPVFARHRSAVQAVGRWLVTAWQQPVRLPGATTDTVTVRPGDFVLGDDDGAVVVPADAVDDVLARAEALTATEIRIREALAAGRSLADCLDEFGHV